MANEVARTTKQAKLTHSQIFEKIQRLQSAFYVSAIKLPVVTTLLLSILEESHNDCLNSFNIVDRKLIRLCSSLEEEEHAGESSCDICDFETCKKRNWSYSAESRHLYKSVANYVCFKSCNCKKCSLFQLLVMLLACRAQSDLSWQVRAMNVLLRINIDCKLVQLIRIVVTILKRKWLFATLDCRCALMGVAMLNRVISFESRTKYYKRLIVSSSRWLTAWILRTCFRHSFNKLDITKSGKLGLLISVNRFDFYSGFKFSTYARWWVKHRMFKTSILPVTIQVPKVNVFKICNTDTNHGTTRLVSVYKSNSYKLVSLDQTIGDDCDLHSVTAYDSVNVNVKCYKEISQAFMFLRKLVLLTPREERILRLRGHLIEGHRRSLAKIGNEFGLCRERIRQIESAALAKVRAFSSANVKGYY